jgi:hypothetical protein
LEGAVDEVLDRITRGATMNAPDNLPPAPPPEEETSRLRVPPHSIEAEQSVLGALLLSREAFAEISDVLAASDFYRFEHRLIFGAIAALISANHPVDTISVFESLQQLGKADEAGGMVYLNAVSQSVPGANNIKRHAEIIVERADLRRIVAVSDELATAAFNPQGRQVAEILDDAKVKLGRLAEARKMGSTRVPILSLGELREQAHAVPWLIKHILPAASIGMLFGASGTFKSFIAVDAACHVAHGMNWLGRRTTQGDVLYIAAEGGTGLWSRVCAWHQARKLAYTGVPLHIVPAAIDLTVDSWRVVEAAQGKGITPKLVVIDTLSQTFGGEENSAAEVAAYFRELGSRFRQLWGCSVLIIHHTGHNETERPRGSSAMRANLDYMLGVFRDENQMLATVTCAKQKDGDPFKDISFAVSSHVLGTDEDGDKVTSLVARHLASIEDVQEVMASEGKAGRKGHSELLLGLVSNGMKESELKTVFFGECGVDTPEGRRKAYYRAKKWLVDMGLMEIAQGVVITLKTGATT